MNNDINKMPKDFFWGGSIAAHQLEGAFNEDGKGLGMMDFVTTGSYEKPREITKDIELGKIYPSHYGIDFYHKYPQDIELFKEMGFSALRISIDWSRIFPNGDDEIPNQKGLDYYHKLIDTLIDNNIEPIVTLYHFEMPIAVINKYDGWLNRKTIELYLKFCETVINAYKGKVKYWVTFNEMNHIDPQSEASDIFTYMVAGVKYSELTNPKQALATIAYHMTLASVKAIKLAKEIDRNNILGCVFGVTPYYPYQCKPEDVLLSFKDMNRDLYQLDAMTQGKFPHYKIHEYQNIGIDLEVTKEDQIAFAEGKLDFIGVNYYMSEVSKAQIVQNSETALFGGMPNPYLEKSDWGWAIDPDGLRYVLNYIDRRYQLPMMITENGIGLVEALDENQEVNDNNRIDYLSKHLTAMKKAITEDGVQCIGYLMWGPIDLISATTGEMKKRYGFIYVDQNDDGSGSKKRFKKKSFNWYKKIIESNGNDL